MTDYTALYLPAPPPREGWVNPSRSGFTTEQEAWNYVRTQQLCDMCKSQYEAFLQEKQGLDEDGYPLAEAWPACTFEWEVVETSELEKCETIEQVLEAGDGKKPFKGSVT